VTEVPLIQAGRSCAARRRSVLPEVAILAVGCVILFAGLGSRSLWHLEGRWAEITRQMFLTGDFFHPRIGGEPYFDKPLLTYWLVAGVAAVTGRLGEWTVRVPNAVAGLVTVLATMWMGRRLWSADVGRIAGVILLTSYGLLFWSRTANADLENLAAITVAIAWYWANRERPGFGAFLGFYLIVFVGALTKGLPAVVVPMLAVVTDVAIHNRWRQVLKPSHGLAVVIGLAVYIAPFWYAARTSPDTYGASGLALVFRENIIRFFQPFDHKGPVYLYMYYLPVLLMPWAPLFVAAVVGLASARRGLDTNTRWLLYAAAVIFAFFTVSGSRRGYYILPLVPFGALMIAILMVHLSGVRIEAIRRGGMVAQGVLLAVIVLAELAGSALRGPIEARLGFALPRPLYTSLLVVGVAAALVGLVLFRLGLRAEPRTRARLWAMTATAAVVMGGFFCWQQDIVEVFRTERPFARQLKMEVATLPPERIGFFRTASANLFYYLDIDRPAAVLRSSRALREFLGRDGGKVMVTQRQYVEEARKVAPQMLAVEPELTETLSPWGEGEQNEHWVAWLIPANRGGIAALSAWSEGGDEE
jgi:4-amino-4-deoxy-L-arabinose transferase-like glycosyltransferase